MVKCFDTIGRAVITEPLDQLGMFLICKTNEFAECVFLVHSRVPRSLTVVRV